MRSRPFARAWIAVLALALVSGAFFVRGVRTIDQQPGSSGPTSDGFDVERAVICLDAPHTTEGGDSRVLFADYASANRELARHSTVIPSLDLLAFVSHDLDGALYLEMETSIVYGRIPAFLDPVSMVRRIRGQSSSQGVASAWLWGALASGDFLAQEEKRSPPELGLRFLRDFKSDKIDATPIGFYDNSAELRNIWRFMKYLSGRFLRRQGVPDELAGVLRRNPDLKVQYARLIDFYSRMTNRPQALTLLSIINDSRARKSLPVL